MKQMMKILTVILAFGLANVFGQDALVGEHTNATYFAKQYTDIQGLLYSAIDNGFKAIRIAEGTYFMPRSLQIRVSNVSIFGSKASTVLQLNNTKMLGLAVFVFNDVSNVSIVDIEIDGYNNVSQSLYEMNGVAFVNVSYGFANDIHLKNFRNGMFVNNSTMISFNDIQVNASQHDGMLVRNSSNIIVSNSSFNSNGRHGINFQDNADNVIISFTNVSNHAVNGSCGLRLEDASIVSINNNNIDRNRIGICLKSIETIKLSRNMMTIINGQKCIHMVDVSQTEFMNNECNNKLIDPTIPPPSPRSVVSMPPPPPPKRKSSGSALVAFNIFTIIMIITTSVVLPL
jgi:parallel beta-helix repeat protein